MKVSFILISFLVKMLMNVVDSLQKITSDENIRSKVDKGVNDYVIQKKFLELERFEHYRKNDNELFDPEGNDNKKSKIKIISPFTPQFNKVNMMLGDLHLCKTKRFNLNDIQKALYRKISQENELINNRAENAKNGFIKAIKTQIKKSKLNINM